MSQCFRVAHQPTISGPSIKVLCIGEQQVGKSSFLSYHVEEKSQYHLKDSPCQTFLKRYNSSLNRKIWVEFYQLSNTYPQYLGCYMQEKYEAVIFFYDMTDNKSRNRLNVWMRLLQEHKKQQMWNLPVLLIGLKKNLLSEEDIEQVMKDVMHQFDKIFSEKSFLYFGQDTDSEQQNFKGFQMFIKRVASKTFKDSTQWEIYKLIESSKTYNYIYSYFQLIKISASNMVEKMKSAVEAMNLGELVEKASQIYVRFTDKLSDY